MPSLDEQSEYAQRQILILVVDRDPHIRELEAHFLNKAGFKVAFAVDGLDALAQAKATVPDVIISEILVPKLDGLALCRRLKAEPATQRICMLIFSILAASQRAREAGADAFLPKPLAEHRLIETVQQLLGSNRMPPGDDPQGNNHA